MALNVPDCDEYQTNVIVRDNLENLIRRLHTLGFDVELDDLNYELLSRCEYIGIPSEKLYPGEDLPDKFGVHRGYNGGGIHGGLGKTEIDRLPKNRIAKAERALDAFEACFWQIFKDLDSASEAQTGEPVEAWDTVSL